MNEERKIIPHPDNRYCPSCGSIYQKGAKFCPQCGAKISDEEKKEIETTEKESDSSQEELKKKNKKKKALISIIILLLILLLGGGAFGGWYYFNNYKQNKDYESKINSLWSGVVDKSEGFKESLQTIDEEKDLTTTGDKSLELERYLKNKIDELDKLETKENYQDLKKEFKIVLERYADYLSKLRSKILDKDLNKINIENDFIEVDKIKEIAKDKITDFENKNKFLKDQLNNDVFNLSVLKNFIIHWQKEKMTEEERITKEKAEKEAEQAQKLAEETVNKFMGALPNAYSATDKWAEAQKIADNYWYTPSMNNFRNDYKYYFLDKAGSPMYIGGQVIKSEKINNTKFEVTAEERTKYAGAPDSSENKYLSYFIVEKIGNAGWFITSHGMK